ncbi:MAG TPA: GTP 3',8-cyclase MoaA [Candidatus Acidoferrales bacterium]|nr:GTP 3',8-cyclase MoaA [Candidatus Acidoferrales bacterium]
MHDPYNRPIKSLRISVTQKCNLKCLYCHREGEDHNSNSYEITAEEIAKIAKICREHGVRKVKFSGGEPLLRDDLDKILKSLPSFDDVSMTTNGLLLKKRIHDLQGLNRVNISLDTLDPKTYKNITGGKLDKVLEGIEAALEAGLTPIKLNVVVMDGINDHEIGDMINYVRRKEMVLQLIELMDFNNGSNLRGSNLQLIESILSGLSNNTTYNSLHKRKRFKINDAEIEIVRPIDNTEFCMNCNRLRVTSDAKLKPCLLRNDNLVDVKGIDKLSDARAFKLIKDAVNRREPYYRPRFINYGTNCRWEESAY